MLRIPTGEYHCMPYGEFIDLVSCWLIAHGAAEAKVPFDDEAAIPTNLI